MQVESLASTSSGFASVEPSVNQSYDSDDAPGTPLRNLSSPAIRTYVLSVSSLHEAVVVNRQTVPCLFTAEVVMILFGVQLLCFPTFVVERLCVKCETDLNKELRVKESTSPFSVMRHVVPVCASQMSSTLKVV